MTRSEAILAGDEGAAMVTRAELATMWGRSRAAITKLFRRDGAPQFVDGKIALRDAEMWRSQRKRAHRPDAEESIDITEARRRQEVIKAKMADIEYKEQIGLLVPRADADAIAMEDGARLRTVLMAMASRLTPALCDAAASGEASVAHVLDQDVRQMLESMASSVGADNRRSMHALAHCAPPPRESMSAWAERCLVMGTRQPTAFPGPFRLSNSPYIRGIMDALDDASTRLVVIEAGAQTGKTTLGYAWLAHAVATDPAPALVVYPSEDLARSNSATRIQPLFEDSPELAKLLPPDRRQDWQLLQYRINGASVHLTGGNSPAQVSSRPIRYVLLDEVDKYPAEALRGEADVVSLALQRQKTYWNRQAVMISTPTTPTGLIHRHFLRGDMREYEVPCPHCHEYTRLRWSSVKWPEGRPELACIRCPHCGTDWSEHDRRAAIQAGRWQSHRADGEAERGVVSYHLPSLLALWVTPAELAVKFVRIKSDPVELQDFVNSDLAEPYIPVDARISNEQLRSREGDYEDGKLRWPPSDDIVVYGGVDVQQGYLVCVLRQHRRQDAASALIWHGILHTFAELDALLTEYGAEACCLDARYRSDEVYEAALTYPGIWPTIGVSGFRIPAVFEQQSRNIDEGKKGGGGRTVSVLVANSNALLDMLHARVSAQGAPSWEIPRGVGSEKDYALQMSAMYRNNGAWVNPRKLPEHYADAEKLSILAAWYGGIRPVAPVNSDSDNNNGDEND